MKIAIAGGHSKLAGGAVGYLNEYECDRAFVAKLIPALTAAGHTVVNCSNEKGDQNSELAEEVRLANDSKADLFLAVHLNAGGGTGTEAYTYTGTTSKLAKDTAAKMSANVASALGIANRGAKQANFYVLRKTTMAAVLLEVCFVDNKTDYEAWKRTSWDALCKAVVSAVGGTSTAAVATPAPAPSKPAASAAAKPSGYDSWVAALQKECNAQGFSSQTVDGLKGPKTLAGCPTLRKGAKGNITKLVQQRLIALGYSCGKYGADSSFGDGTLAAVKAFQAAKGLTPNGIVGQNTWRKLLGL